VGEGILRPASDLRGAVTVDWQHRESARAAMRMRERRILRRFG
jgi:hypothetical protein